MTRREVRHPDWPLFLVALAGICLSFACGGEAEMPQGVEAEQEAERDAHPGPASGAGADRELRSEDLDAGAGLLRFEATPGESQVDPKQALVADPVEIVWFDYAFDEASPPRVSSRAKLPGIRARARGGSSSSAAGSSHALMGR